MSNVSNVSSTPSLSAIVMPGKCVKRVIPVRGQESCHPSCRNNPSNVSYLSGMELAMAYRMPVARRGTCIGLVAGRQAWSFACLHARLHALLACIQGFEARTCAKAEAPPPVSAVVPYHQREPDGNSSPPHGEQGARERNASRLTRPVIYASGRV